MRTLKATCLLSALLGYGGPSQASELYLQDLLVENDAFVQNSVDRDRFYTHGLRMLWARDNQQSPRWAKPLRALCCSVGGPYDTASGFAIGQQIFTPEDIGMARHQPMDRPWAAYLYGSLISQFTSQRLQQRFALELGIIGPPAGGEEFQQAIHEVLGYTDPEGWRNQLDFEPTVNFAYLLSRRYYAPELGSRHALDLDFTPHVGFAVGTVRTYANAGFAVRLGRRLQGFPTRGTLMPAIASVRRGRASVHWIAAIDTRFVGHNLFLDGSLFQDGPSVAREDLVHDLSVGVSITTRRGLVLDLAWVRRSAEFEPPSGHTAVHQFGSIGLRFAR